MTPPGADPPNGDDDLKELMRAVRDSADRAAFDELVRRLSPGLTSTAYRLVAPAYVPDLVQEAWLRAWRYRRSYGGEAHPYGWLRMIIKNVAAEDRAFRLTANRAPTTDDLECVSSARDIEAFLVSDTVDRLLGELPEREAMVIRRRWLDEADWTMITTEMGFDSAYYAQKCYRRAMQHLMAISHRP